MFAPLDTAVADGKLVVPGLANLLSLEEVDHVPLDSLRLAECICICQPAAAASETSGAEIEIN